MIDFKSHGLRDIVMAVCKSVVKTQWKLVVCAV